MRIEEEYKVCLRCRSEFEGEGDYCDSCKENMPSEDGNLDPEETPEEEGMQ